MVEELVSDDNEIVDSEIYHMLTQGDAPYIHEKYARKFRTYSFFLADNVREAITSGRGDYIPIFLSEYPQFSKRANFPSTLRLSRPPRPTVTAT